ncbi:hypothetical protein, partial [Nocardia abscessus]|uniref:hypothetical protein n=1 Tax=Nocardia abscessus TaxID=120957 RepID=UPI002458768D
MGRHSSLIALGTVRVRELFAGSRRRPGSAAPARRVVGGARRGNRVQPEAAFRCTTCGSRALRAVVIGAARTA